MHLKPGPQQMGPFYAHAPSRTEAQSMLFYFGGLPSPLAAHKTRAATEQGFEVVADQRRRMSDTCMGVQVPPRAVLIPRAVSAR
jgi:hypothetical protein